MKTVLVPNWYLPHNVCDGIAGAANAIDRQAVTVAGAYEHLCDEPLWIYRDVADGLDPWILLDGLDRFIKPCCIKSCKGEYD